MLPLTSAAQFDFDNARYNIGRVIDSTIGIMTPFFEQIIGDYSSSEFFFNKILLLILLIIIMVSNALFLAIIQSAAIDPARYPVGVRKSIVWRPKYSAGFESIIGNRLAMPHDPPTISAIRKPSLGPDAERAIVTIIG